VELFKEFPYVELIVACDTVEERTKFYARNMILKITQQTLKKL